MWNLIKEYFANQKQTKWTESWELKMFASFWFATNVDLPKEAALEKIPRINAVFQGKLAIRKTSSKKSWVTCLFRVKRCGSLLLSADYYRFATFGSLKINNSIWYIKIWYIKTSIGTKMQACLFFLGVNQELSSKTKQISGFQNRLKWLSLSLGFSTCLLLSQACQKHLALVDKVRGYIFKLNGAKPQQ